MQSSIQPQATRTTSSSSRQGVLPWLASHVEVILPAMVFLVALFLRFYRIDQVPQGLLYDESYNAIDALNILAGDRPLFLIGNYGREALFIYLQALSIALLGQTDVALRVVSAVIGFLTVVFSFLLVRRLFGPRLATLACAWLAISLWHVVFSRIGLRTIMLPLIAAATFYCLWRALEISWEPHSGTKGWLSLIGHRSAMAWFTLAGALLGLSLYTYTAARFLPLAVGAFALYLAVWHRQRFSAVIPGLVVVTLIAIVVFLPEGLYFLRNPSAFFTRAAEVSIFNTTLNSDDTLGALGYGVTRSLTSLVLAGDERWDRNIPGRPIFDPAAAVLLGIGLVLALRRFRDPRFALIVIWIVAMLGPSMLALRDAPNHLRLTGIIPAVYVLPALGAAWLWSEIDARCSPRSRSLATLAIALAFLVGTYFTYQDYFLIWGTSTGVTQAFNQDRWTAIGLAQRVSAMEGQAVYAGAGDADGSLQRYALPQHASIDSVRLFNSTRSIVFPAQGGATTYIFASRDLPPRHILDTYLSGSPAQTLGKAFDGTPITLHKLRSPLPPFAPDTTLNVQLGDSLKVLGLDVPQSGRAGDAIVVRWYWEILRTDSRELGFFNQLYDEDNQRRGQTDDRAFTPDYWPPGTRGISTFEMMVDPETTTGAGWLLLGVYDRKGMSRLPIVDDQGRSIGTELRLGPIKIQGRPRPATAIENAAPASFDDNIRLLGYDLEPKVQVPGQSATLTLYWSALGRPSRDYTIFVHLLNDREELEAQSDGPPRNGRYPTSIWDEGEVIVDVRHFEVNRTTTPGTYHLAIGLYDPSGDQRLAVVDESGRVVADHVTIPNVRIR